MDKQKIKNIWSIPKYLPYVQATLDEALINEAEAKIGFKFPKEYIELLQIQNGGYIRYTLSGTPHHQISGIGPYYPSITNFEWLSEYEELSFEVKNLFPFDGDGHWNICLDYRTNKEHPQITYIDTETDWERVIAESFQGYLDKLVLNYDVKFVIDSALSREALLLEISKCLDIKFQEPSSAHHGYPIYVAEYKKTWIQLSPNKVPAGFIREGEKRYDELKSQMEEMTLRYPELSDKTYFIGGLDGVIDLEIFELLSGAGIIIEDLKVLLG